MSIDVLALLGSGKITEDEAHDWIDAAVETFHLEGYPAIEERIGFSEREMQARCLGVSVSQRAKWRKEGWPTKCSLCGESLDLDRQHWFANPRPVNGQYQLEHAACGQAVFRAIRASLLRDFAEEESVQIVGPSVEFPRGYWIRFDGEGRPVEPFTGAPIDGPIDDEVRTKARAQLPPYSTDGEA